MTTKDPDVAAAAAGIAELLKRGIPTDVVELLVSGDPTRGVKAGALSAAIMATIRAYLKTEPVLDEGKLF